MSNSPAFAPRIVINHRMTLSSLLRRVDRNLKRNLPFEIIGMKGRARHYVEQVRRRCHEQGIPVLIGQFDDVWIARVRQTSWDPLAYWVPGGPVQRLEILADS